jgi:hypothetical protein
VDYLDQQLERFRRMQVLPPPPPWRHVGTFGVGGLGSIGFGEGMELLLVESTDGCGVFDCETGERVARDRDHNGSWEDLIRLRAAGIGPLAGRTVRMAGLHGGGLPQFTIDGWSAEIVCPDWPAASVILSPKTESLWMEDRSRGCVKICELEVLRACGFSDSGRSLAVAESSHTLYLFHRPQPMPGVTR